MLKIIDIAEKKGCDALAIQENFATQIKATIGATTEVIKQSELHSFVVLPKRWVVERFLVG